MLLLASVDVAALPWGAELPSSIAEQKYDLILGASITYYSPLHKPLCASLRALLSRPQSARTRVVLSHDKRKLAWYHALRSANPTLALLGPTMGWIYECTGAQYALEDKKVASTFA